MLGLGVCGSERGAWQGWERSAAEKSSAWRPTGSAAALAPAGGRRVRYSKAPRRLQQPASYLTIKKVDAQGL